MGIAKPACHKLILTNSTSPILRIRATALGIALIRAMHTVSVMPKMTIASSSPASMNGGMDLIPPCSRSSIPANRLAWTSTPGKSPLTGVARKSASPGAVVPTNKILPCNFSLATVLL